MPSLAAGSMVDLAFRTERVKGTVTISGIASHGRPASLFFTAVAGHCSGSGTGAEAPATVCPACTQVAGETGSAWAHYRISGFRMERLNLSRLNVLVVDDNRHTVKLLENILHGLGIRNVIVAGDAAEAFGRLRDQIVDLAVVDWEMEPMNGVEFVRMIRGAKDSPNPFLPVIMLTGYTKASHVIDARDAGINEYLAKPVSPKSLYQRIVSIIDNPRSFVRTDQFFGPDRRRRSGEFEGADRRKAEPEDGNGLTSQQVQDLLRR